MFNGDGAQTLMHTIKAFAPFVCLFPAEKHGMDM